MQRVYRLRRAVAPDAVALAVVALLTLGAFFMRQRSVDLCERADTRMYSNVSYAGICEGLTEDDPDLRDNPIGNDRVSSVRVGGQRVALYADINYEGACLVLTADTRELDDLAVGNDAASSVRIGEDAVCAPE